jgi:hypothetical protein
LTLERRGSIPNSCKIHIIHFRISSCFAFTKGREITQYHNFTKTQIQQEEYDGCLKARLIVFL